MSEHNPANVRDGAWQPPGCTEPLPCTGCGWCCMNYPCDQSLHRHGYTDRCPELRWSEERRRYLCAMASEAQGGAYMRAVQRMGKGCCAPSNPWRDQVRERE